MRQTKELADFILAHYPPYREWERWILERWIGWHNAHGFIQCALNDKCELVGLLICRPVMKPEEGDDFYSFDPEGSCIFVDVAIATRKWAIQALVYAALQRFGMRDWIAWKRGPYYVTQFHDAHRFRRLILQEAMK